MIFVDGTDENGERFGYIVVRADEIPSQRNGKVVTLSPGFENAWDWEPLPRLTLEEARQVEEHHQACMMELILVSVLEANRRRIRETQYWLDRTPPHIVE